uniref:Uncharacterized protein n=1 Tax=Anopheles stephensi TaxID=30069 RepID=A0A182Y151_ANOST
TTLHYPHICQLPTCNLTIVCVCVFFACFSFVCHTFYLVCFFLPMYVCVCVWGGEFSVFFSRILCGLNLAHPEGIGLRYVFS